MVGAYRKTTHRHLDPQKLSLPHTCGPDPAICCQFDFVRHHCPWPGSSPRAPTEHQARKWLDQVQKKAMLYQSNRVLIPVGDDFRFKSLREIEIMHQNYKTMFDWINANTNTIVRFSTLEQYFENDAPLYFPTLTGSFFPYADQNLDYWTGYYNSRIDIKQRGSEVERLLFHIKSECPSYPTLTPEREFALYLHHDTITGTSKPRVMEDALRRLAGIKSYLEKAPCATTSSHSHMHGSCPSSMKLLAYNSNSKAGAYLIHHIHFNLPSADMSHYIECYKDADTTKIRIHCPPSFENGELLLKLKIPPTRNICFGEESHLECRFRVS